MIAKLCAGAALLVCVLGVAGHLFDIRQLSAVHAGWQVMSVLTAAGLGLIAVRGVAPPASPAMRALLALIPLAIATVILVSHGFFNEDRVNPWLFRLFGTDTPADRQGRTSTATALSMLVLAAAALPVKLGPWKDRLAAVAFVIAAMALLGYAYGAKDLYSVPMFNTMALNTAVAIILIATTVVMSTPDRGWAGTIWLDGEAGRATRRQIAMLALPIALGWLLVHWAEVGSLGLGAAMALLVLLTVVSTFLLILRDGRALESLALERRRIDELTRRHTMDLELKLSDQASALLESNAARLQLAEEAQAHSEGRYRTLFDSIDPAFCVIEIKFDTDAGQGFDYRFLETNAAFMVQTGMQSPLGKWMRDCFPRHEQLAFSRYGAVARTGEPMRFELQVSEIAKRWYDVHAFCVDDPSLHRVGILFSDVTIRKKAEASLLELNRTLESRIRTEIAERELAHAALRQSQKMEAIGQLTGGVAHDFNNLLAPIMNTIEVFIRKGGSTERELRLLQGAMRSAERAKILIQRLLAFARRQPLQIGPVDLVGLINGLAELISSTLGAKIRLEIRLASDLVPVTGDANQIEMAILNLCVNSRHAMPSGGHLIIAGQLERLELGNRAELAPGRYVCLSVIDSGVGMDEQTLKRAIEPFFSTKGVGQGTGLGLSMAHGLASQLGGSLTISSTLGEGTRVDLWLKPSVAEVQALTEFSEPRTHAKFQGRALVVDDEEWVRASTCDMLQEIGYQTQDVDSAEKAEALLHRDSAFDLVVTDQMMPGMSGTELVRIMRQRWPKLPVLVVSGFAEVKDVTSDVKFLSKPFRLQELSEMITEVVQDDAPR